MTNSELRAQLASLVAPAEAVFLDAKIEAELAELDDAEALELLQSMGQGESGLNQLARIGFDTLGLQTYLTAGPKESRAWTIRRGATAPEAAGVIHTSDVRAYPDAIAQAAGQLRLEGVNGPYSVLLGAEAYIALSESSDHGYPVMRHIKELVDGEIIWAPAISGAFAPTTRGCDFGLYLGEDVSIGYLSHDDNKVRSIFMETFTFLLGV